MIVADCDTDEDALFKPFAMRCNCNDSRGKVPGPKYGILKGEG